MFAEITIAILLLIIVAGFSVYFFLQIKKTKDSINQAKKVEEENIKLINSIRSTHPSNSQLESTHVSLSNAIINNNKKMDVLQNTIDDKLLDIQTTTDSNLKGYIYNQNKQYADYSKAFSTLELNIGDFQFSSDDNILTIMGTGSNNKSIKYTDFNTSSLSTSNLSIGPFNIEADSRGDMNFRSSSAYSKINFLNNVTMSNVIANDIVLHGKLNFASIDTPTTFDLSPEGNLRLIMEKGSNGTSSFRSFDILNDSGQISHKFDSTGTATHQGDVNITGSCIKFGSNNGNICYDIGKGMTILGGNCNVVTISDNMNTGSLSTKTLGIGELSITSSNGSLVVLDNRTNSILGNIAYMQQI